MVAAARTKSLAISERDATHGNGHSFGGTYLELVPNERIRSTDEFEDAALPSEIHVTIVLKEVAVGTDLHIPQEGVPDVFPSKPACWVGRTRSTNSPSSSNSRSQSDARSFRLTE